jgi:hypothetical protein
MLSEPDSNIIAFMGPYEVSFFKMRDTEGDLKYIILAGEVHTHILKPFIPILRKEKITKRFLLHDFIKYISNNGSRTIDLFLENPVHKTIRKDEPFSEFNVEELKQYESLSLVRFSIPKMLSESYVRIHSTDFRSEVDFTPYVSAFDFLFFQDINESKIDLKYYEQKLLPRYKTDDFLYIIKDIYLYITSHTVDSHLSKKLQTFLASIDLEISKPKSYVTYSGDLKYEYKPFDTYVKVKSERLQENPQFHFKFKSQQQLKVSEYPYGLPNSFGLHLLSSFEHLEKIRERIQKRFKKALLYEQQKQFIVDYYLNTLVLNTTQLSRQTLYYYNTLNFYLEVALFDIYTFLRIFTKFNKKQSSTFLNWFKTPRQYRISDSKPQFSIVYAGNLHSGNINRLLQLLGMISYSNMLISLPINCFRYNETLYYSTFFQNIIDVLKMYNNHSNKCFLLTDFESNNNTSKISYDQLDSYIIFKDDNENTIQLEDINIKNRILNLYNFCKSIIMYTLQGLPVTYTLYTNHQDMYKTKPVNILQQNKKTNKIVKQMYLDCSLQNTPFFRYRQECPLYNEMIGRSISTNVEISIRRAILLFIILQHKSSYELLCSFYKNPICIETLHLFQEYFHKIYDIIVQYEMVSEMVHFINHFNVLILHNIHKLFIFIVCVYIYMKELFLTKESFFIVYLTKKYIDMFELIQSSFMIFMNKNKYIVNNMASLSGYPINIEQKFVITTIDKLDTFFSTSFIPSEIVSIPQTQTSLQQNEFSTIKKHSLSRKNTLISKKRKATQSIEKERSFKKANKLLSILENEI